MISALGYSNGPFNPSSPGRLCRGRERWIESFPIEQVGLHRLVISGAAFSDASAADAQRGLPFCELSIAEVLGVLFPGAPLLVAAEDAPPELVPEGALGVEHYQLRRPGGPLVRWGSRWLAWPPEDDDDGGAVEQLVSRGADVILVGPVLDPPEEPAPTLPQVVPPAADEVASEPAPGRLREPLFLLMGYRQDGGAMRAFQASALPGVLELSQAVVLIHLDKHGPCLGIYTTEPLDYAPVEELGRQRGVISVPFAIPPMLARWDRAIWELRQDWDEATRGEFPVPPSTSGRGPWGRRSRPAVEE